MLSLNGTLKKSGSVGRWETKQFIGKALISDGPSLKRQERRSAHARVVRMRWFDVIRAS